MFRTVLQWLFHGSFTEPGQDWVSKSLQNHPSGIIINLSVLLSVPKREDSWNAKKWLQDNDSEDIFSTDDHKNEEDLEERMAGIDLGTV